MENRFEKVHSREGTWSRKWDGRKAQFGTQDILPLWVADMDFEAPEIVKEALMERINHGIFGYVHTDESVLEAICSWFERRHGWSFKKEDIVLELSVPNLAAFEKIEGHKIRYQRDMKSKTETYEYEKSGIGSCFARILLGGGYATSTKTYFFDC